MLIGIRIERGPRASSASDRVGKAGLAVPNRYTCLMVPTLPGEYPNGDRRYRFWQNVLTMICCFPIAFGFFSFSGWIVLMMPGPTTITIFGSINNAHFEEFCVKFSLILLPHLHNPRLIWGRSWVSSQDFWYLKKIKPSEQASSSSSKRAPARKCFEF